jgi:hypothetical protein
MADDKREKRGLRAKWQERRAHRAEPTAQAAERTVQKAEEHARLEQAREAAAGVQKSQGRGL